MSRRSRIALVAAAALAGLVLIVVIGAVLTLRSSWFREKVRARIVDEVERATGGRTELGSFSMDWTHLRAEVRNFVLHGTEPPGKPPLFQAESITVGLKIVSVFKKKVDIESLEIRRPRFYLMVFPEGGTNIPAPKIRRAPGKPTLERIVDLAVRRFEVSSGIFEIEARKKTPIDLRGENLAAQFDYSFAGPRYQGHVSINPLDLQWGSYGPLPIAAEFDVAFLSNRIELSAGRFRTGRSEVDAAGAITDVVNWTGRIHYQARASLEDVARFVDVSGLREGQSHAEGDVIFRGGLSEYRITGDTQSTGVAYREGAIRLRDFRVNAAVDVNPDRTLVSGIRVNGISAVPTGGKQAP